jgi:hypothetical protein
MALTQKFGVVHSETERTPTMRKHLLTVAAAGMATIASSAALAAGGYERAVDRIPSHAVALLSTARVSEIVRAQHIRSVGDPYLYNGRYLLRCYDHAGQLAYCTVDPYSGEFLGVHVTL